MKASETNPRVLPVADPNDEQNDLLSRTRIDEDSPPLNLFTTMLHNPRLLKRFNALGGFFLKHGTFPARERELVIMRVATRIGSPYELAQHRKIGMEAGLTHDEIENLGVSSSDWPEDDRLLLQFVDELLESDGATVPSWEPLSQRFRADQMLELSMLIGFYRMLAGFLNVVRIQVEDD